MATCPRPPSWGCCRPRSWHSASLPVASSSASSSRARCSIMSELSVRNLTVKYGSVLAVDDVSFSVAEGEFVSLLGPSGCGKTTTLRCIAGLESASSGEIRIGNDVVVSPGREMLPEQRGVNMVFQSYAVWPHMTVFDNVAYGLRSRKVDPVDIAGRVTEILRLVGLARDVER